MNWPLPLLFVSWGFRHGGAVWQDASQLANLCLSAGVRTVAVQQGLDERGLLSTEFADAEVLRARGLRVVVWGVAHAGAVVNECQRLGCDPRADWLPQVEGPGQYSLVIEQAANGLQPQAIVTNYSGAGAEDRADVLRLRGAGVKTVMVECYNDAGALEPYTDLERMLGQGVAYGWRPEELVATAGTYHGEMPGRYKGLDPLARRFGLYLGEPMSQAQWAAWKEQILGSPLVPPAPKPPPTEGVDLEPVTNTQGRESVEFAVQAAAQNWGDDPKPKGRLTVCRRIAQAANDDVKWNKCRDAIVRALDAAGIPA